MTVKKKNPELLTNSLQHHNQIVKEQFTKNVQYCKCITKIKLRQQI